MIRRWKGFVYDNDVENTAEAIAGKWHTRLCRIFVRHQGATSGASSNYVTVERSTEDGRKDKLRWYVI
jgi:hypothetical protein